MHGCKNGNHFAASILTREQAKACTVDMRHAMAPLE
jgi:hypothetical protein